jgi:hypothetical protein
VDARPIAIIKEVCEICILFESASFCFSESLGGLPQGWTDPQPGAVKDNLSIYPWMNLSPEARPN